MNNPFSETNDKQQAMSLLRELINKVQYNSASTSSLLNGRSGELLFLYQAAKYDSNLVDLDWLSSEINKLMAKARSILPDLSIGYGLAGIAWFYQYILQDLRENDQHNFAIDNLYSEILASEEWRGEFEYVLGLAGFAPYVTRRSHTALGKRNVIALIAHFSRLAVWNRKAAYWPTLALSVYRINKDVPTDLEVNLGLAHGQTGVIAALLGLSKHADYNKDSIELLRAGCEWIIEQQQDKTIFGSCFPNISRFPGQSRLGWCYGDLTVALTLARVGNYIDCQRFTQVAIDTALHAAKRDHISGQIHDAGICHGSSGLALIFYLLFRELKVPELMLVAKHWFNFFVKEYHKYGIISLCKWTGKSGYSGKKMRQENFGLLEGYAGIGLCLLVGLGQEPNWVDALLLA